MGPLSTGRMDTRGWLFPLLGLRVAAALATNHDEVDPIRSRLALAIQRVGDDSEAASLLRHATIALRDDPPLPVGQLAVHPAAPIRQAAALCWGAVPDSQIATVRGLAADSTMSVRQHAAWVIFDVLRDREQAEPELSAILSGLAHDGSRAVRVSAIGADRH